MKTLERKHRYNSFTRIESKVEEIPLHEDFLILAKFAEDAAKAAYAYEKHTDANKKEAERLLYDAVQKVSEQFTIMSGYEIIQAKPKEERKK